MKKFMLAAALLLSTQFIKAEGSDTLSLDGDSMVSMMNAYADLDSVLQSMEYKTGSITLNGDLATITIPEGFAFLGAQDAQYVLTDAWGNPKDETVLGMMVPKDMDILSDESWAIIYTYEEDGHVEDDDAEDIDYDDMLKDMKEGSVASNEERAKMGYQPIYIVGWAQKPFYDKATHKLHWAKELQFGTDSLHTLNYNIRMLGRKGVLVMNVIAGMDHLKMVNENVGKIIKSTEFNAGNRYDDFDSSMDKVAEYGIGGLIAGGVLAKTGLLAKLGLLLVKAWKIIAIGVVGAIAFFKKRFTGRKEETSNSINADRDNEAGS